jgi:hypothetical protein
MDYQFCNHKDLALYLCEKHCKRNERLATCPMKQIFLYWVKKYRPTCKEDIDFNLNGSTIAVPPLYMMINGNSHIDYVPKLDFGKFDLDSMFECFSEALVNRLYY